MQGKPGVSKGGQTILVSDVDRIQPRAYMHRHKLHKKEDGFTMMSHMEVRNTMLSLEPMIEGKSPLALFDIKWFSNLCELF